ncbi:membrane fusion protein, multidrug efflux system [Cribrihabitans marinus]|uniref:Membrane fusion protein, multidrug efflux system n=1 Tax=Cribrihabitans marinus TaxID=1227549 RepID=A0A1H6VD05_9RHOB|nr:efflux RND transporter periplasmic adaptor subunit [Cribrihabitans marinus]GGH26528.1 hemolysin D [Cribrihabitans marinus]SEI98162.1 membrane fusion protein, multidrug efflux system [Cribrihabitans marinus]
MRLIPLITAVLVTFSLYMLVFERDALLAFATGEAAAAQPDDGAATDAAAESEKPEQKAIGVVAVRSKAREIDSGVVLRGETEAMRQVEVRSETSSPVISEPLRKGAFVEAGQLLCELDPGTRPAQLAEMRARESEAKARLPEAEARLIEAKARLREAEINNNAAQKLSQGGFASETRRVATEASVRSAEAGIKSAEAGLESMRAGIEAAAAAVAAAQREIDRLTIEAPFDGLLESDTAELGSLMQPGSLCATVIQLDPIKLVGYVPETEVGRITNGAPAQAQLATGQTVEGTVTFISRSADETTRTFEVEITAANPDLAIRSGQTATISVSSAGSTAHRLPQSALTLNNEGQLGVRAVGADNRVEFHAVEMIRDDTNGVWLAGLPDTVDVIVVGQDFVTEGVAVAPTYREAAQ